MSQIITIIDWIAVSLLLVSVVLYFVIRFVKKAKRKNAENSALTYTVYIDGMSCEHCKARVEAALKEKFGGKVEVNLEQKCAYIKNAKNIDQTEVKTVIDSLGFSFVRFE